MIAPFFWARPKHFPRFCPACSTGVSGIEEVDSGISASYHPDAGFVANKRSNKVHCAPTGATQLIRRFAVFRRAGLWLYEIVHLHYSAGRGTGAMSIFACRYSPEMKKRRSVFWRGLQEPLLTSAGRGLQASQEIGSVRLG